MMQQMRNRSARWAGNSMQFSRTRKRPEGLPPCIPEESGSDSAAAQKLLFCIIVVFQKCRGSQVMNVIMARSVQK